MNADSSRELVALPSPERLGIAAAPRDSLGAAAPASAHLVRFAATVARRWWKWLMPLSVVLSAAGAAAVYWQFAPEYQAAAWLKVHQQAPFIAFQHADDARQFVGSLKELMRSRLLLSSVVSDPEVAKIAELQVAVDPIAELSGRLDVASVGNSEYFAVYFRCQDSTASALVANKVAQAYIRLQNSDERLRKEDVLSLLESERRFHEGTVKQLRGEVEQLTQAASEGAGATTSPSGPEERQESDSPLADLQKRFVMLEVDSAVLRAEIAAIQGAAAPAPQEITDAMLNEMLAQNEPAQQVKEEIEALDELIREYERNAAPSLDLKSSLGYRRLTERREARVQELDAMRTSLRELAAQRTQADDEQNRRKELQAKQASLQNYDIVRGVLQEQINKEITRVKRHSGESLELEFKRAELQQATDVFNLISQRMLQLRTEMRAPDRVVLQEAAPIPAMPIESLPLKKMLMVALVLMVAPFGLAIAWEKWVDRVSESAHLEQQSHLRVVGEVVSVPRRQLLRPGGKQRRDATVALFEECVDNLRTCIVLSEPTRDAQVVAFTSAISHEGKTSLAVQFAQSAARATREPVLLIDGDVRCPDIHRIFSVPLGPGLSNVLSGDLPFDDAVVKERHERIHILPAGKLQDSPHKLFAGDAFARLLEQARAKYRYIVIDTPPVLAAGEALILAKEADTTLICAMRDVSRLPQVRAAHQRLLDAGARPSGAVLSGVSLGSYRFRYGGYDYRA